MFDHNKLGQLLSILPIHLKSETNYFIYKEAIDTIKILQDKDQRFYSEFIIQFKPLVLKRGTIIIKEGSIALEIYFLLRGCIKRSTYSKNVELENPAPHYLIEGTIFGEQDMIFNRMTQERFTAMADCFVLQVKKPLFKTLIEEFEDFRD
jgi:CRP-like cAMP-binding protein